jgi:hypothetical protein
MKVEKYSSGADTKTGVTMGQLAPVDGGRKLLRVAGIYQTLLCYIP